MGFEQLRFSADWEAKNTPAKTLAGLQAAKYLVKRQSGLCHFTFWLNL